MRPMRWQFNPALAITPWNVILHRSRPKFPTAPLGTRLPPDAPHLLFRGLHHLIGNKMLALWALEPTLTLDRLLEWRCFLSSHLLLSRLPSYC
jgi:hypothetical protein